MLRLLLRVLTVPLLALIIGGVWLHVSGGAPTPSDPPPRARAAPRHEAPAPVATAGVATPLPGPAATPDDVGNLGRLGAELWTRLNRESTTNATREWGLLQELSEAARRQIEQLAPLSSARP